jgi:hypothetical protein
MCENIYVCVCIYMYVCVCIYIYIYKSKNLVHPLPVSHRNTNKHTPHKTHRHKIPCSKELSLTQTQTQAQTHMAQHAHLAANPHRFPETTNHQKWSKFLAQSQILHVRWVRWAAALLEQSQEMAILGRPRTAPVALPFCLRESARKCM